MTYVFRCVEHGDTNYASREMKVCWCGARLVRVYRMPHIAAAARPTSAAETVEIENREKRLGRDRDAYKRLREAGIQPKSIDGAAALEINASTKTEVEMGQVMPLDKVREGVQRSSEMLQKDLSA